MSRIADADISGERQSSRSVGGQRAQGSALRFSSQELPVIGRQLLLSNGGLTLPRHWRWTDFSLDLPSLTCRTVTRINNENDVILHRRRV